MPSAGRLLLIVFFACSLPLSAQEVTVINSSTGQPIENVAIYNKERKTSILSNAHGKVDLSHFHKDDSLYFQHPSFHSLSMALRDISSLEPRVYLSEKIIQMEEFIISASRIRERRRFIPFKADVLRSGTIMNNSAPTAADALLMTGNVTVQKSQGGGGSPVLRGFEANKILLVVDGVRMNNIIYRSGHLQNSITIDQSVLDRIEIVYGPSSVMYGSDALGGVIHYMTKDPVPDSLGFSAALRHSTADRARGAHLDFNAGSDKFSSLSSVTVNHFGDIRIGRNRRDVYGSLGLTPYYADRLNGQDTMLVNSEPEVQKRTGYRQIDLLQKFRYTPGRKLDLTLNLQYSTSGNIDRYDRLNNYREDGMPEYADWYYGPQNRFLASLKTVHKDANPLFTHMTNILAFQRIDEDRITRKFGRNNERHQEEDVSVYTAGTDFLKVLKDGHRLNYGTEFAYNRLKSGACYRDIVSGSESPAMTRYPGGSNHSGSLSAYLTYKWIYKQKLILNGGARYQYSLLQSDFGETDLPFDRIRIGNGALTGNVSMVYHPRESWQINLITATGFRNPNVDDYGKVRAKDELVTVPNDRLGPEYTYNLELGIKKSFGRFLELQGNVYHTWIHDAIVRTHHQLNGSDSLFYDGDYYRIITNANASNACISGASFRLLSRPARNLTLRGTMNLTRGRNLTDDVPLGHIPPLFGIAGLRYTPGRFSAEVYTLYHGLKEADELSPYGEDNAEEGVAGVGFPSWATLNLRSSWRLTRKFILQLALENLLDTYYKPFASGVSRPGINLIITLRATL